VPPAQKVSPGIGRAKREHFFDRALDSLFGDQASVRVVLTAAFR
jgi:hypothetical protein